MRTHGAEHSREARAAAGFTLIEVLAALVIVALGMLGVIEAVTQSARNGTYLREKMLAHWVAMNVVTEQRLLPAPPPVAESSDDVELAGQRWHWTMKVSQTQAQSMRRIDVSVRPADAPDTTVLASVSGYYGTAIVPAGGAAVAWGGDGSGARGDNGDDEGGGGGGTGNQGGSGSGGTGGGSAGQGGTGDWSNLPRPRPDDGDE